MTNALKQKRILAAITAAVMLITTVLLFVGPSALALGNDPRNDERIHYFNDDVQGLPGNGVYQNGPSAYAEAKKAKTSGTVKSILDYVYLVDANGVVGGNLRKRMKLDPALTGELVTDTLYNTSVKWDKILGDRADDYKDVKVTRLPDTLHKDFLKDYDWWQEVVANEMKFLSESKDIKIVSLDSYKSSAYMLHNGLDGNKPAVIVRKSSNAGGHAIEFKTGKGTLKWRLECGYQPVDLDYWPVPDTEPVDDRETTKTSTPTKPDEPTTLAPKGKTPLKPGGEYGGGEPNHDPDKTVTPEPSSPSEYKPPSKPTTQAPSTTDGSKGSQSGSKTVDEDDGKQTTARNGQDATVHAGDGTTRQDLGEVQQTHSHDTVEEPLQGDGTNKGDVGAPE